MSRKQIAHLGHAARLRDEHAPAGLGTEAVAGEMGGVLGDAPDDRPSGRVAAAVEGEAQQRAGDRIVVLGRVRIAEGVLGEHVESAGAVAAHLAGIDRIRGRTVVGGDAAAAPLGIHAREVRAVGGDGAGLTRPVAAPAHVALAGRRRRSRRNRRRRRIDRPSRSRRSDRCTSRCDRRSRTALRWGGIP